MKISQKVSKVFNGYPFKNVTNMFAYFSITEHSASFSEKNLFWLRPGGFPPPPFMDWSVIFYFFPPKRLDR